MTLLTNSNSDRSSVPLIEHLLVLDTLFSSLKHIFLLNSLDSLKVGQVHIENFRKKGWQGKLLPWITVSGIVHSHPHTLTYTVSGSVPSHPHTLWPVRADMYMKVLPSCDP